MRFRLSLHIIGIINIILSALMLAPLLISVIYKDGDARAFVLSFAVTLSTGLFLFFSCRGSTADVGHREGFVIVAMSWISAVIFSALPFYLSGVLPSLTDCLFEATSGLTTTGASVFTDVEALQHGVLFWRSMTHWIGGMGIVLLGVAILPFLGIGGMQIYKAEASSLSGEKFAPRITEVAKILLAIYLFLSFVMLVLLLVSDMGIFDSFIHMFGTLATGGFSNKNSSVGLYGSIQIELIVTAFSFLGGVNFYLHYWFYKKGVKGYIENEEFRFYVFTIALATLLITVNLAMNYYSGIGQSLRYALFQVVSIGTTTGYMTADYTLWPYFSQLILLSLMFMGASAGSTAGAIKCVRVLLLFKIIRNEIQKLIHPHAITSIRLNGKSIPPEILKSVLGFTIIYVFIFMASAIILGGQGLDVTTSLASAASALGNVGPALGLTGPASNYAALTDVGKWVLIFDMLVGRLEIYTLLILFMPSFWKS